MNNTVSIKEELWVAFGLCIELSKASSAGKSYDGVIISHESLKSILDVDRIYDNRLAQFAKKLSVIFPFHKIYVDKKKCKVLGLGMNVKKEPKKYLWCHPSPHFLRLSWQIYHK
jgi:hypothetical protein